MSIMDRIRGREAERRPRPIAVITGLGRAQLEKRIGMPSGEWMVLNHLSENGASNVMDIADETGITLERLKMLLARLEKEGYIKRGGGSDEGES